ncbi:MAG: SLBB domain-containing protein [Cyclobacteriaceae bacterium]
MLARFFLLLPIILILFTTSVNGQDLNSLSASDLKSVNVDALSDAQIQKFLDVAKERGLTIEQLELAAQQRGMSGLQISKLRTRIRKLQSGGNSSNGIQTPTNRLRETYDDKGDQYEFFDALNTKKKSSRRGLRIFGLDYFQNAELTFEPSLNVATPENYVLGPGDEIIIDIYGASETTYQEIISPDGKILISGVGPISLSGLAIKDAKNRIFNKLSSIYSGVKGRNPNTFIQVSIGNVRTIKVNVVGNVVQPGTYTLSSFATAFNALYFAGGPTASGSLREINVIRNGEQIAVLDVYKFLFGGDQSQSPSLRDQDVIVVKPYLNRVKLAGNVKQPAAYELRPDETLDDLLNISGGFNEVAYKESLTIDRVTDINRSIETAVFEDFNSTKLQNGDSIYVSKILNDYENRVSIEGAVKRAGFYELTEGLLLSDLINRASGLREDAYTGRGNIIRLNNDLSLKNLAFDVNQVLSGTQDVALSPNDVVRISSIFDLNDTKTVTLKGAVNKEGTFPFVSGMTVEDLLNISGGLQDKANAVSIEIARRLNDKSDLSKAAEIFNFSISKNLAMSDEASGFQLEPFDLILIKSTSFSEIQKVVKIEGEVMFPGYYALETNEDKISDLIERAGGLTQYGYSKGATLIRRTEYFRDNFEEKKLETLIDKKRSELEKQYEGESNQSGISKVELIRQELNDYEKELTENIRKNQDSDLLESRIFRAQQLRKLQQRDSISGSGELVEQEGIGIELDEILKNPESKHDLILRDGDLLSVPKQLQTVRVQGEVLYPNSVSYQDGLSFKQYVSLSGGFSDKARASRAYIVYANGKAQRTKKFLWFKNYPSVQPGADIIVPKKNVGRKLSVTEIVGIASSLATMGLIVDRVFQ